MSETISKVGMGWLPDFPDFRDLTMDNNKVSVKLKALGQKDSIKTMLGKTALGKTAEALPSRVDLRKWFSPVEDQGTLGSCTANAGVGLVEYFERRAKGKYIDASRLFLYKTSRNMAHSKGDTGAFLRTTMSAMVLFGVPPEEYWPYVMDDFDKEPTAFCYAFAQNYQTITYYRLDPPNAGRAELLKRIKTNLAAGLPSMFGFTVYSSYEQAHATGRIPFPTAGDKNMGGHAVIAAGFDDKIKIKNAVAGTKETTGALLIRNSWGKAWGEEGCGWLPYDYVLKGLAIDWWSLMKNEWVDTGNFK
ncbi:MAG: cysteine protease [Deltaproteobacteria bacterium]